MTGGAAADLGYLRDYNEALVLGAVRGAPTFERAGVAAVTGLTPQAVSKVLARLIDQGFVAPIGVTRRGVGKPPIAYRVVASSRYAIGAHVGRGSLRLVLTDFIGDRSMRSPPSPTALPAILWPPPRTEMARSCATANRMARTTSAAPAQRTTRSGERSIIAFQMVRASS